MSFKIVGIGPGNKKLLTVEALEEIKIADKVFAFKRVCREFKDLREDIKEIENLSEFISGNLVLDGVKNKIAILASGDPMFFGIANSFLNKGIKVDIIPGISSCQYLLTKLGISTNNFNAITFHGREFDIDFMIHGVNVFFTDKKNNPSFISKKLNELGYTGDFIAAYDLSYDFEKILKGKVGEDFSHNSDLALAVYINEMD